MDDYLVNHFLHDLVVKTDKYMEFYSELFASIAITKFSLRFAID